MIYGEYKKNNSSIAIKDQVYLWEDDKNRLVVIQTPSALTEKEKSRLKSGENDFMVLFNKESPNKERWSWYPYIVTEISFNSDQVSEGNIKSFYLKAYGIEEANSTDNINSHSNEESIFSNVKIENGNLSLKYSGASQIMEDSHSWSITI